MVDLFTAVEPLPSAGLPAHETPRKKRLSNICRDDLCMCGRTVKLEYTCVCLIAFLWAHGGSIGLRSLLLLAFPANRTEGGGVAQRGKSSLKIRE